MNVEVDLLVETALPDSSHPGDLAGLVEYVLEREGATGDWSIAVVLTGDEPLRALHARFMDDDSVTDIMTFPVDEPGGQQGGDIVISVERATEQAGEWNQSPWEEVRFLVAHGVLHLCGWIDHSDAERKAMLERQRALIEAFDEERSQVGGAKADSAVAPGFELID